MYRCVLGKDNFIFLARTQRTLGPCSLPIEVALSRIKTAAEPLCWHGRQNARENRGPYA